MLAVLSPVQSDVSAAASAVLPALAVLVTVFYAHSTVRKAEETSQQLGHSGCRRAPDMAYMTGDGSH